MSESELPQAPSPEDPPGDDDDAEIFEQYEAEYGRISALPPPHEVAMFEQIMPGAARIIFEQMQLEGAHRREMDARDKATNDRAGNLYFQDRKLGQWFGFLLGAFGLVAAVALGIGIGGGAGATAAIGVGGATLAGLIGAYMHGRKHDLIKFEDQRKTDAVSPEADQ